MKSSREHEQSPQLKFTAAASKGAFSQRTARTVTVAPLVNQNKRLAAILEHQTNSLDWKFIYIFMKIHSFISEDQCKARESRH